MRQTIVSLCVILFAIPGFAAEPPLVEQYLKSGQLARGEQALTIALQTSPQDDQTRLGLGVLQVFRGVERLGQSLYQYGLKSEVSSMPFLRLPLPKNPDPSPISYRDLRRVLDEFHHDLQQAEATLAGIKSDDVKLPLRLATVHLDLNGDGEAAETLGDILAKIGGRALQLPDDNPELLVHFDRGDVAWLRAYCHVLMGLIDLQMSADWQREFEQFNAPFFEHVTKVAPSPTQQKRREVIPEDKGIWITDPVRLNHFRLHVIAVCDLNHETWKYIRQETDDDREWLPNPKQAGVLGLPITDAMIDAWLGMVDEFKALFNGEKVIPNFILRFISEKVPDGAGFSFKKFLDNPPENIVFERTRNEGIREIYLVKNGKDADLNAFIRVSQVFNNAFSVGYAAWFN